MDYLVKCLVQAYDGKSIIHPRTCGFGVRTSLEAHNRLSCPRTSSFGGYSLENLEAYLVQTDSIVYASIDRISTIGTFATVPIVDLPTSCLNSQGVGTHAQAKTSNVTKHKPTQFQLKVSR